MTKQKDFVSMNMIGLFIPFFVHMHVFLFFPLFWINQSSLKYDLLLCDCVQCYIINMLKILVAYDLATLKYVTTSLFNHKYLRWHSVIQFFSIFGVHIVINDNNFYGTLGKMEEGTCFKLEVRRWREGRGVQPAWPCKACRSLKGLWKLTVVTDKVESSVNWNSLLVVYK